MNEHLHRRIYHISPELVPLYTDRHDSKHMKFNMIET